MKIHVKEFQRTLVFITACARDWKTRNRRTTPGRFLYNMKSSTVEIRNKKKKTRRNTGITVCNKKKSCLTENENKKNLTESNRNRTDRPYRVISFT